MSARVRLRPLTAADLPQIEPWYPEAAAAVLARTASPGAEDLRRRAAHNSRGLAVISRAGEPEPIGLIDYRNEPTWLTVRFIALASGYRGWGYGSEAVRLLEARTGATRVRAGVYTANGLGLYFWLRLGYRPHAVWPETRGSDMISMIRDA